MKKTLRFTSAALTLALAAGMALPAFAAAKPSFSKDETVYAVMAPDGSVIPDLLAAEITAKTGKNPAQLHQEQVERFGESWYKRVDTPTTLEQKQKFAKLTGDDVEATQLAGEDITAKLTEAPGNHAKIGGLKVTTKDNWFAARPSGTENIYKVYAESFESPEALDKVLAEATEVVDKALAE